MTISLERNDADTMLFKKYAEMNAIRIYDLVRNSKVFIEENIGK